MCPSDSRSTLDYPVLEGRFSSVAQRRKYRVESVADAKSIAMQWLKSAALGNSISFGLPEVDDRYHIWRVPLKDRDGACCVGEVVIDARSSLVDFQKTTSPAVLESRLLHKSSAPKNRRRKETYRLSPLRNTVGLGDCEELLADMPAGSVDLVFTSPPYYNARPEYADYISYDEYLLKLRKVVHQVHRVLADGRFFIMNTSPVLLRRASRNESSSRIAVPFDVHSLFIQEGYEFIDDIIWVKPEGAGWATGRGRRFAADRNPLQYKPVPVTEYVLAYRKKSDKLIDWFIRNHPDREAVARSKIPDGYERTNIWKIHPAHDGQHPAVFPVELAEKVVSYYSFVGDVVLDPFAGTGTVGEAAARLRRRFVLFELVPEYVECIKKHAKRWLGARVSDVLWLNCAPPEPDLTLFASDRKKRYGK